MARTASPASGKRKLLFYTGALCLLVLITAGIFAKNGWFPSSDPLSGKRTGWFGKPLAKNAPSAWNPLPTPAPTPPPLSKEYIYAGSRLLSVVDANAQEVPPSDLAIWRSNGEWWVLNGSVNGNYSTYSAGTWGMSGDKPEPGDYDGDGKTDFCIFRPSTGDWWVIASSSGAQYSFQFGISSDIPVPADYDGDGKTDAAFYRINDPSSGYGTFYIRRSSDGSYYAVQFGLSGDTPKSADFDGDGKADVAVWRGSSSTYYSLNSSNGAVASFTFLDSNNQPISSSNPVSADYDGDGKADYAIRQSGSNNWIIRNSGSGTIDTIAWQNAGDTAVQNDYDGDGKCDIAVWRDATGYWYIRPSSSPTSTRSVQWGASGDFPEPAYFRR